jgi:hypothetical protein
MAALQLSDFDLTSPVTMIGIICVLAALIGGGLKASGVEIPVLVGARRQVSLGLAGLVLVTFVASSNASHRPRIAMVSASWDPSVITECPRKAEISGEVRLKGDATSITYRFLINGQGQKEQTVDVRGTRKVTDSATIEFSPTDTARELVLEILQPSHQTSPGSLLNVQCSPPPPVEAAPPTTTTSGPRPRPAAQAQPSSSTPIAATTNPSAPKVRFAATSTQLRNALVQEADLRDQGWDGPAPPEGSESQYPRALCNKQLINQPSTEAAVVFSKAKPATPEQTTSSSEASWFLKSYNFGFNGDDAMVALKEAAQVFGQCQPESSYDGTRNEQVTVETRDVTTRESSFTFMRDRKDSSGTISTMVQYWGVVNGSIGVIVFETRTPPLRSAELDLAQDLWKKVLARLAEPK